MTRDPSHRDRCPRRARLAAAVAALALVGLAVPGATPPAAAEPTITLTDADAPLGLATDHARNRFWVLSEESGTLRLHAFTGDGQAEGTMSARDRLVDGQALAFVDGEAYVGDIGGSRGEVVVYRVTEPWPGTEINHAAALTLAYPDGAHDAAALFVDANHRIGVVTRGDAPGVYLADEGAAAGQTAGLTRVTDAPADVTDATALVDGRVVLRTATELVALDPASWTELGRAGIEGEQSGHAVTETVSSGRVLTGLADDTALVATDVPGPAPADPTAEPTREPPAPAASTDGETEAESTRTFAQTGTTTAIVAALAVSAVAAMVVLLRR